MTMRKTARVGLVALLVVLTVFSAGFSGVAVADDTTTTPAPTTATTAEENSTTTTTTPTAPTDGGDSGEIRLYPVDQRQDWVSTERKEPGNYSVTGPYTEFESLSAVSHASVREPGASARVIGDKIVRVEFDSDAAPPGETSLYTLQVRLEDGTTDTIQLHVSDTNVDVGVSDLQEHRTVVLEMMGDAEEEGYERSPEGLRNYYDSLLNAKELYESAFVQQGLAFISIMIALATNPVGILVALLVILALVTWLVRTHGDIIRTLSQDDSRYQRLRRELQQRFRSDQRTAASTRLREVDGIGMMGELYWRDAYGVTSIYELGELAKGNLPVQMGEDGEIKRVGGVENLTAANVDNSWIEKVTRDGRLASVEVALDQVRTAVGKLETDHGMGHRYGDVHGEIERLLDELDETHHSNYPHTGGDD